MLVCAPACDIHCCRCQSNPDCRLTRAIQRALRTYRAQKGSRIQTRDRTCDAHPSVHVRVLCVCFFLLLTLQIIASYVKQFINIDPGNFGERGAPHNYVVRITITADRQTESNCRRRARKKKGRLRCFFLCLSQIGIQLLHYYVY